MKEAERLQRLAQSDPSRSRLITGVRARLPDGSNPQIAAAPQGKPSGREMNKWERLYALELKAEQQAGNVLGWWFEPWAVRLAKATWYWVDFFVVLREGFPECIEIKGHLRDDAAVKFKVAREVYPMFSWRMLRLDGGSFVEILT